MESPILVLWDLDLTLLDPAGFGHRMIAPALADVLGREPRMDVDFAGRTDRAILTDLLAANGALPDGTGPGGTRPGGMGPGGFDGPDDEVIAALLDAVAERCEQHAHDLIDAGGGPLPGAHEAVAALDAAGRDLPGGLHQGIVTGNMRRTALLKLRICGFAVDGPAGLGGHRADGLPDPLLGAYGDDHLDRAYLVRDAMIAARDAGLVVVPPRTVVVGDTLHDVRAAQANGASCVGVATGRVAADVLLAAGADVVLPDLTDAGALIDAVTRVAAPA